MRRVSYHQSVFDLIGQQPPVSPAALGLIEDCERHCGQRMPEAVRQWYARQDVVPLAEEQNHRGTLWYDYSNTDWPESLQTVLGKLCPKNSDHSFSLGKKRIRVLVETEGNCEWFLEPDGSPDPPVAMDLLYAQGEMRDRVGVANHFSEFVFDWFAEFYNLGWTPISENSSNPNCRIRPARAKPYLNRLWLYAPMADALAAPDLDFLIEHLTEDARRPLGDGVMQYEFHNEHGRIRVTTDAPDEEGGVSAWWLHADSEEGLFQLARGVLFCVNLRHALKYWTKTSRPVMERLHELRSR